jgi:exosortase
VPPSAVASSASVEQSRVGARSVLPFAIFFLALGVLWFVLCKHLSAEWSYNEQYNYGWFVPFFALYLFWLRWEDGPSPEVPPSSSSGAASRGQQSDVRGQWSVVNGRNLIALAIAIPALFVLLPLRLVEIANPDWRPISWLHAIAAVLLTLVTIWYAGGRPWLRHFAFPVVFFLVAVPWLTPIEDPIIQRLMPVVASIATETLSLFGTPAEVQGSLIRINNGMVGVNEACSGVRSLQTSIMIGLLFGELKRLRIGQRVLLVAAAIAIAFVANCGRAFFLVWIAATRGIPQVDHWHDVAGYAIVGLVFLGCLGVTALLAKGKIRKAKVENDNNSTSQHLKLSTPPSRRSLGEGGSTASYSSLPLPSYFLPSTFYLVAALCWLLLVEAGAESWYRGHERNLRASAQWNVRWPESAPDFRELKIDERTRTILHNDEGRGVTWRDTRPAGNVSAPAMGEATCLLYFFRWHSGHNSALLANAHRPDICLPSTGWRQTGDFGVRNYEVTSDFAIPFRHFEFTSEAAGRRRFAHAFYCVWEDRASKEQPGSETRGLSERPSAWSRSERVQAVLNGRRHMGQQVTEYLRVEPREIGAAEAEQIFAASVRELISPGTRDRGEK